MERMRSAGLELGLPAVEVGEEVLGEGGVVGGEVVGFGDVLVEVVELPGVLFGADELPGAATDGGVVAHAPVEGGVVGFC